MRIKVNINEPKEAKNTTELQTWIENHSDGQADFFVAAKPHRESLAFQFVYDWMLGCHRFFIYDPIGDELLSFYAEDFTDIGKWIFKRCDEYFGSNYEILM